MQVVDCIGIDLGTTNSCVAYHKNGKIVVVSENGRGYIPSVIAVDEYKTSCGSSAELQKGRKNVAYELKRILGKRYSDPIAQACKRQWSFEIRQKENDGIIVHLQDKNHSYDLAVNELYAMLIKSIVEKSEAVIGDPVKKAVITVPATFSDIYRSITMLCAEAAGLEVVQILEEPVAAAICYADQIENNSKVLVFDMGGGTFDVCILEITADEHGNRLYKKLATDGDPFLGGMDITEKLGDCIKQRLQDEGHDIPNESKFLNMCEKIKIEMSMHPEVDLGTYDDDYDDIVITREELEHYIADITDKAIQIVNRCVERAGLSAVNIDSVIMVGGSSNLELFRDKLKQIFRRVERTVNVEEVVAKGALMYYMGVNGMLNNTTITLRMETNSRYVIQQPNDQVYVMMDNKRPYGVEIEKKFTTFRDGDSFIQLPLAQGNSSRFSENQYIGRLIIRDIPIKPKGEVVVTVHCKVDMNGIVHFSAKMDPIDGFLARDAIAELSNPVLPTDRQEVTQTIKYFGKKHEEIEQQKQKARCQNQLMKMKSCLSDRSYEGNQWIYYSLIQNWCEYADATSQEYQAVIDHILGQLEAEGFARYEVEVA